MGRALLDPVDQARRLLLGHAARPPDLAVALTGIALALCGRALCRPAVLLGFGVLLGALGLGGPTGVVLLLVTLLGVGLLLLLAPLSLAGLRRRRGPWAD